MPGIKTYEDCYYRFENNELEIGNNCFSRCWSLDGPLPSVISLKRVGNRPNQRWYDLNADGRRVGPGETKEFDTSCFAFYQSGLIPDSQPSISISSGTEQDLFSDYPYYSVVVGLDYGEVKIDWHHLLYPQVAIHRSYLTVQRRSQIPAGRRLALHSTDSHQDADNLESDTRNATGSFLDHLPLEPRHVRWTAVSFADRTDLNNDLVNTNTGLFFPGGLRKIQGNLLLIKDSESRNGLTLIKEGPTSFAYQGEVTHDYELKHQVIRCSGWGMAPDEVKEGNSLSTYCVALLLWDASDPDGLESLHAYHERIRTYRADRDAAILSNTWGDRSRDGRVSESFILDELDHAAALGISHLQIDDGWQSGTTVNSVEEGGVWEGYHQAPDPFWSVNSKRFPNGLEPVAAKAKDLAIKLGLWFSPDSDDDFANWEADTQILIDLHRRYGIRSFKLDGIKIRSKLGEERLFALQHKVIEASEGQVNFNLDTTAEIRNGYFGRVQYGQLFLENRYTDWRKYYPHWSLRNLWQLAKYYPTHRIQLEFLNVKRNAELYESDPLAPLNCGIGFCFSVTLFANPLAWMELSGLDEADRMELLRLIRIYSCYQEEILGAYIQPVGSEPDGYNWSGFHARCGQGSGFLLIYRFLCKEKTERFAIPALSGRKLNFELLMGEDNAKVELDPASGELVSTLDTAFSFGLFRYQA